MDTQPHYRNYPLNVKEWNEIKGKVDEHDDSLYGNWDEKMAKREQGLVEKINAQTFMLKVIGAGTAFSIVKDIGVPTQDILPIVVKLISSILGA
jgi:hypothetical protein